MDDQQTFSALCRRPCGRAAHPHSKAKADFPTEMEIAALNLPRDTGKRAGLQHLQLTKTSLVLTIRNPFQTILGGKGRRRGFTIIHRCLTTSSGRMKTRNTRAIRNKSSNLSFRFILSPSPSPPPPCPSLSEALGLLLSAHV